MCAVMDKEKPCLGSMRGFDMAAVRPMTAKLAAVSMQSSKSMHNPLDKPAYTGELYTRIPSINVT
jgi:hypothetical protein